MANLAYNIRRWFVWLEDKNTRLHDRKGQQAPQVCADPNRGTGQVARASRATTAALTISLAAPKLRLLEASKFKTTPHHDGRMHRSQKSKKPFTAEELMARHLAKVG